MEERSSLNYKVVQQILEQIRDGKRNSLSQYFLNPSLEIKDAFFTIKMFVFLVILRFALAGAHHQKFRNYTAIFKLGFRSSTGLKHASKFCENLWYTCWHIFSLCFGIYVLLSMAMTPTNPGWTRLLFREFNVRWYWFPTPAESQLGNLGWPTFPMTPLVKSYYLTELSFWLSCAFFLFIETIRDDFYALLLHHNITCLSILISYCLSFWRIGIIILILHDVADVVLYTAKTVYYYETYKKLVDILFSLFAFTFFVSRLVIFPLLCIRPVLDLNNIKIWSNGVIQSHWQIPGAVILSSFLCILQMLHIFWFVLIMKMIVKTLSGVQGDIRSDAESDVSGAKDPSSLQHASSFEGNDSDDEDGDQRMKLSSLPGVRPTLTKRQVKASQKPKK